MPAHVYFTAGLVIAVAGMLLFAVALLVPATRFRRLAGTAEEFARLFTSAGAVFIAFSLFQVN